MRKVERYVKDRLAARGLLLRDIADRTAEPVGVVIGAIRGGCKDRALPIWIEVSKATGVPLGYLRSIDPKEAA